MRRDGDSRLGLAPPAQLQHSSPQPHCSFPSALSALQTPTLICRTPISATSHVLPPGSRHQLPFQGEEHWVLPPEKASARELEGNFQKGDAGESH